MLNPKKCIHFMSKCFGYIENPDGNRPGKKETADLLVGGYGGDYRTRTCDLLRVKQAL